MHGCVCVCVYVESIMNVKILCSFRKRDVVVAAVDAPVDVVAVDVAAAAVVVAVAVGDAAVGASLVLLGDHC